MNDSLPKASVVNRFGKESSLLLTSIVIVLVASLIALTVFCIFLYRRIPDPVYFAVSKDKKLFVLPALNEPSLSLSTIQSWSSNFAINAHNFDFNDIDNQIIRLQKYFTQEGFKEYLEAASDFRDQVVKNQLVVSSIPMGAPVVQKILVKENTYMWLIEIPLKVRFDSSSTSRDENRTIRITVQRIPTETNPYGIAISQYSSLKAGLV